MKVKLLAMAVTIVLSMNWKLFAKQQTERLPQPVTNKMENNESSLAQIAILLDTSGSMKGLVDQARMQIWNVVNELSSTSKNGKKTEVEVAVFQYGSDDLSSATGYIKKVLDFSRDLDEVSRALFSLTLNGGKEYCGEAVRQACDDLQWDASSGFRAIFIAGNESFDQGNTSFASVLPRLDKKSIRVNTIYCQWKSANVNEMELWRYGAQLAAGKFAQIDHNKHFKNVKTPFDAEFRTLNQKMNDTFIWFGKDAQKHMRNQSQQDSNAQKMSNQVFADRMATKIGHLYKHMHSDLVDAVQHGKVNLAEMPKEKMPERIGAMPAAERKNYVNQKIEDREAVRREMTTLISKRDAWLRDKMSQQISNDLKDTWGSALVSSVKEQLEDSGFKLN